jgi:hypothetical protein
MLNVGLFREVQEEIFVDSYLDMWRAQGKNWARVMMLIIYTKKKIQHLGKKINFWLLQSLKAWFHISFHQINVEKMYSFVYS